MNRPPYPHFPVLTSAMVLLRPVQPADAESLLEISFYDARPARSTQEAAGMQARIDADYQRGTAVHWAIISVASAAVVGTLGYYRGFAKDTGELGCVLKPAYRGQGLMTEAMRLAIAFGLGEMKLAQIIALTTQQNTPAIALLEKLGFRATAGPASYELRYQLK